MWNMITHFLTFTGGMSAGVVLMCLMQAAKQEDEIGRASCRERV